MTLLSSRRTMELTAFTTPEEYYCRLLKNDIGYVYIGQATTDSNTEGMRAAQHFDGLATIKWLRRDSQEKISAMLLRIDRSLLKERLELEGISEDCKLAAD